MGCNNQCTFIGNLGSDPDMSYSKDGSTAITDFSLAVRKWNSLEKKEETMWLKGRMFGKRAETLAEYTAKGSKIAVSGEIDIIKGTNQKTNQPYTIVQLIARDFEFCSPVVKRGTAGGSDTSGWQPDYSEEEARRQKFLEEAANAAG